MSVMDYGDSVDRKEGLRLTPDQMREDARMIAKAWPELHVDVMVRAAGKHVGVLTNEPTEKRIRHISGVLFPFWRKLLTEPPIMLDLKQNPTEAMHQCNALLLVGNDVIRGWRDDLLAQELWGRWGVMNERWMVMPIQHPDTLAKGSAERWGLDVRRFFEGYVSGVGTWGLSGECVKGTCGNGLWKYDGDGVAWCEKHWVERYPEEEKVGKAKARRAGDQTNRMMI